MSLTFAAAAIKNPRHLTGLDLLVRGGDANDKLLKFRPARFGQSQGSSRKGRSEKNDNSQDREGERSDGFKAPKETPRSSRLLVGRSVCGKLIGRLKNSENFFRSSILSGVSMPVRLPASMKIPHMPRSTSRRQSNGGGGNRRCWITPLAQRHEWGLNDGR